MNSSGFLINFVSILKYFLVHRKIFSVVLFTSHLPLPYSNNHVFFDLYRLIYLFLPLLSLLAWGIKLSQLLALGLSNALPSHIHSSSNVSSFKISLKFIFILFFLTRINKIISSPSFFLLYQVARSTLEGLMIQRALQQILLLSLFLIIKNT